MFHWDDGLKLTKADLAIDFRRRQPRAFISHAHADHMARHQYALCTPETAALYQHRLGCRTVREMPYRETIEWGGLRLTTYPAGHCLGSAMLLAEEDSQTLLYTGDFKLSESATAERAELPHADIMVIESTYGRRSYRMPPRQSILDELFERIRGCLDHDQTPVIEAYVLGKAQEITCLLTTAGFQVRQHPHMIPISRIYESFGVALGAFDGYHDQREPGTVLIVPPRTPRFDPAWHEVRFAVTGWALDPSSKYRLRVDHALPLSDHADFDELIMAVHRVKPTKIYCTHGPESFVDRLCEEGFDAYPLDRPKQGRLFH